jgi:hypothetical protein
MKICQRCNKKFNKNSGLKSVLFFVLICLTILIIPKKTLGGGVYMGPSNQADCTKGLSVSANEIAVFDSTGCNAVSKTSWEGRMQSVKNWLAEKEQMIEKWSLEKAAATAYKESLRYFLNTLAVDTATYLASGDEGQKPMFFTDGWGGYLKNAADNAAGTFLETLGKDSPIKFNLCQPNLAVNLKINLGLLQGQQPQKPQCTFSKMKENWEKELKDPNFLNNFQDMFNPWSNDLGIALSLQTGIETEISKQVNSLTQERIEGKGWLSVQSKIDDKIKTPAAAVGAQAEQPIKDQTSLEKVYTGDIVADAIDIFINTLAGKLLDNWFKKGLVTNFEDNSYDWSKLSLEGGGTTGGGIAGAKERFKKIIQPNFSVRGDYNILAELTTCPNPNKAGPTNCVITENFRQAVANKLTVGEAMKQGYLNPNGIFGFTVDGLEPAYNEGYPYRAMIILRKFRILPVGWEMAAQYIKANPNKLELQGTKNLKDLVDCFAADDDYEGYEQTWCAGLVDPNWVLKAPLNYCKREGPGPEITNEQITGSGDDSERNISRKDNYCGDEQSCIKEKDDGSCRLYGYCTEERRKWDFNGKTCEPNYNTCQTFKSPDGKSVSYLENTLDYGSCSAGNAGCKWYCEDYNYTDSTWACGAAAGAGDKLYLDRDAEACDVSAEGCHQFIRTKPGLGANLLSNSSFEDSFVGTIWDGLTQSDVSYDGLKSLSVASDFNEFIPVGPADYSVAGETYALSFYAKDCGTAGKFGIDATTANLETTADWQYYRTFYVYPLDALGNTVNISITGADPACLVDAIKLERGAGTQYSNYGTDGTAYLKLAPDYLNCDGISDPAECDNFVRQCAKDEVGCEIYTPSSGGMSVAAKVSAQDYCPAECVGYNTFVQKESTFDSLRDSYFIAKTGKTCSAAVVGCDEFTNLDEVKQGGEGKEYYKVLRQCIKPNASCAEFYTWEGSDETGYQLRVFQYQGDNDTDDAGAGYIGDPAITQDDSADCSEAIYNLPPSNPAYNADCRQFYNKSGGISYHLYSRTITCSDDCHPYRRTENNIAPNLDSATCGALGDGASQYLGTTAEQFNWDNTREVCYFCKNGGKWNDEQGACLYDAIPKQGQTCSASSAGCRDYVGNSGNNLATVLMSNFNFLETQGWSEINGSAIVFSTESIIAGADQNSLQVSDGSGEIFAKVDSLVEQGGTYVLSFVAKKVNPGTDNLTAKFINGAKEAVFSGLAPITNVDWNYYELNLINLDHQITSQESLIISAGSDYYIDDIKLSKVTDKYYLIKNSWKTPSSCDEDIFGNPWALYMLGCNQYRDRANETHYLHSFTQPCSASAAGCELVIDTHNSNNYLAKNFNVGTDAEENVLADNFTYVVYDKEKECSAEDKGCQRLGDTYKYEASILFGDAYLRNNPDKYEINGAPLILCAQGEDGCQEWKTSEGLSYFKDPGDQVCEWRQPAGTASGAAWLKKKIKKCDDGSICLKDGDCAVGTTCKVESTDFPCTTDPLKTFGYGGTGSIISQPIIGWAGICPAAQSGCGEYIDPLSKFSENLIFNSDFSQNVDGDLLPDGWTNNLNGEQNVKLESNTVYILSVTDNTATLSKDGVNNFYRLTDANLLTPFLSDISLTAPAGQRASIIFYTDSGASGNNITLRIANSSVLNGSKVELKKAIIDYQLAKDLDKNSCNGVVDFENGCVLFNERFQDGNSKAALKWDADLTYYDETGKTSKAGAVAGDNDSNLLLKVSPDRICDQWLACRSFAAIKDEKGNEKNTCYDIGLCDSVDENGDCDNFVLESKINQETDLLLTDFSNFANASGYSKVGYDNPSTTFDMKGLYPLGEMEQKGEIANISNGNFEFVGANRYPTGWIYPGSGNWNENVFSVIDNPVAAQTEGIGYAPEGRNFLKLGSSFSAESEYVDVIPDANYILTAYMNTINLADGDEQMIVEQYDDKGSPKASKGAIISYVRGGGWKFQLGSFKADPGVFRIKVIVSSTSGTVGNFYVDDIKITPALESRCLESDGDCVNVPYSSWYTPQSCRLYPEDDALSCKYFDESGIIRKGWPGYCLEYDRYPGSANACLMWWPVDRIKGDGVEEGGGYTDRFPLYYCTDRDERIYNAKDECSGTCKMWDSPKNAQAVINFNPPLYDISGINEVILSVSGSDDQDCEFFDVYGRPDKSSNWQIMGKQLTDANPWATNYRYAFTKWTNGNPGIFEFDIGKMKDYDEGYSFVEDIRIVNLGPCDGVDVSLPADIVGKVRDLWCTEVVQTVSPAGQNKAWSGRVYNGSDFKINCTEGTTNTVIQCAYSTDSSPFGSMYPPDPESNPALWDGKTAVGVQPIYFIKPNSAGTNKRAGQYYNNTSNVQRLFAQSYGSWRFTDNVCLGGLNDGMACFVQTDCEACDNYCVSTSPSIVGGVCDTNSDCVPYIDNKENAICNLVTFTCDSGCNMGAPCTLDQDCRSGYCDSGSSNKCIGGFKNGVNCSINSDCSISNCFTCDISNKKCSDGSTVCATVADCPATCSGGGTNSYTPTNVDWLPPADLCNGTGLPLRPDYTASNAGACLVNDFTNPLPSCDLCSILPIVSNINVDNIMGSDVMLPKNKFAKFSFTTDVDSQQMPMVMYAVDWGDNEKTVVTGVEMRDKPSVDDPQILYHLYSYWDLKAKQSVDQGQNTVYCGIANAGASNWSGAPAPGAPNCGSSSACCMIKPKVQIKDNWGWCNQGTEALAGININACTQNQWESFGGWVVVEEK